MGKAVKDTIQMMLEENNRRWDVLRAEYDPVSGKGLADRVELKISDFAIPVQHVPKAMMRNRFVKAIAKAGSVASFLKKYPDDPKIRTAHDVEIALRRIRHKYDYYFWAYFCFPIISKEGGEVRFRLNYPQQELNNVVQSKQDEGVPLDVAVVKARQWGGSTYCISKQMHILFKLDNYHSFAVAAHVQSAAENILRMMKHAISKYPAWDLGLPEDETLSLMPAGKTGNAYAVKDSHGNQVLPGLIYIGSAQYPDSLRSPAVRGAHYSEVGVWPNTPERRPEDLIASISGGILHRPLAMQVMESTAKSADDFFHEIYVNAKKGYSNYAPLFIPWFHIPHDTLEITDKKEFIDWLVSHKDEDKPNGRWRDTGKHYWRLWELGATLEGINWYRYKRLEFTTYAQMANEAPSTDVEAFQSAGAHVFDIYQVEALRKFCKPPYKSGILISDDRRDKGVLNNIKFIEKSDGNLNIWEFPDTDTGISNRYLVSVDIGGPNPTSDFHSVRVFDRAMMMPEYEGKPSVVAEMHYHCKRDDLVYDVMRLAEWYQHALLVIESNTLETHDSERSVSGDGSQYVLDVASGIYSNLYARESPAEAIEDGKPTRWGFSTNTKTKPLIIDLMQWAIADQAWTEPSEICVDELGMYIEDHNKFTAPAHKHDDVLMATAIGLWVCFKEMPLPKWKVKDTSSVSAKTSLANF